MIYLSLWRCLRIPWLNKHERDRPANIFPLANGTRVWKVGKHPTPVHPKVEQIQILSVLRFNLSAAPWGHGTAPSNLSLAIGLLPLTSPKVLSPSATTRCGHMCPHPPLLPDCCSYKTIWNLAELEQETVSLSSTAAHFTCALSMPRDLPDLKTHLGTVSGFRNMFPSVQCRISSNACLKFQRKGIGVVVVSEWGIWVDCTWAIMKKGNPFQTKSSGSQIKS